MAATKSREYLYNLMRTKSVSNWRLFDGKEKLDEFIGTDIDNSVSYLDLCLDAFAGSGIVNILLTRKNADELADGGDIKTGVYKIKFDLSTRGQNNNEHIGSIAANNTNNEIFRYQNKIENLEKEISELKNEISELNEQEPESSTLIEAIKPYIPAIAGLLLNKIGVTPQAEPAQGINGIGENKETDIIAIVKELEKIDKDICKRLNNLLNLAINNPNMYNMAAGMLDNMYNDAKN